MADDSQVETSSGAAIVTAIIFNGAIALACLAVFLYLRPRNRRIYDKRIVSSQVPQNRKPRALQKGVFAWFTDLVTRPDKEILAETGLDGYFFLRYLRMMFFYALAGLPLLWPVLMSLTATSHGGLTGLNKLQFGNISPSQRNRYYAHVFFSWLYFGLLIFMIYRELLFYTAVRAAALTCPAYRTRISSRTIFIASVPKHQLNEAYLAQLFPGVEHVYVGRDVKDLEDLVKQRSKLLGKVEGAANKVLKKAIKARMKAGGAGSDNLDDYVKKWPTHRLKFLIGEKVETLEYAKKEIPELNSKITTSQKSVESKEPLSAAFITFQTQSQAEAASQVLSSSEPLRMTPKFIGLTPDEVYWPNLRVPWWKRMLRATGAAWSATCLIVFWAIPVAFVGFISQIDQLIALFHWMSFLKKLPSVLYGLVSSLLPIILLAVLMMLLPIIIRMLAKRAGAPSNTHVEYYTQKVYFIFQLVQVFFVTTVASSAMAVLPVLVHGDSVNVLEMLQNKVPAASNFYISYFLLQALVPFGMGMLQIVAVLLYYAFSKFLDGTPRKKWNRQNGLSSVGWGTEFPPYTLLACITIIYSIIAPFLLLFAALLFGLAYVLYLHNLTFISKPSNGRGIFYARAIKQLFAGLYTAELCLVALFVFSKRWAPVVLEAVMVLVTIYAQMKLGEAFNPMLLNLPRTLTYVEDVPLLGSDEALDDDDLNHAKGHKRVSSEDALIDLEAGTSTANGSESRSFKDRIYNFLMPHKTLTPHVLRQTLLSDPVWTTRPTPLTAEEERVAYLNPAFGDDGDVVWLPSDPYGWAEQLAAQLQAAGIKAHTDGARVDLGEKKAVLEVGDENVPIYSPESDY